MRNNYLAVLKRRTILQKTTITSCVVKPCMCAKVADHNDFWCKIYFVLFLSDLENIFTMKISRPKVVGNWHKV